jgi:flagellar hook-associated protein 3 FlgL
MRVNPNFEPTVVAGIEQTEQAMQAAEQQVSTGLRVQTPSDDPEAAAALVGNQAESASVDQYTSNAQTVQSLAEAGGAALSSINTLLTQAISLGTEGANGTVSASQRQTIAAQIQGILTNVVSDANTTYGGAAIFGGTANPTQAFAADPSSPTGYIYQGNDGVNTVQVGDAESVQANIPGSTLFTNSDASVLGSLSQLATALASGSASDIGTATNAVSAAQTYLSSQQVILSNSSSQVQAQETYLNQEQITLSTQQNNLIGVDPATAAENLAYAEEQNSSALAAAAKVLPTTLLDYLK